VKVIKLALLIAARHGWEPGSRCQIFWLSWIWYSKCLETDAEYFAHVVVILLGKKYSLLGVYLVLAVRKNSKRKGVNTASITVALMQQST
jgi:hypothetical protein